MGEKEVDIASAAKDFSNLFNFLWLQFWVQVERAQLRNEEFEIRTWHIFQGQKVWVKTHSDKEIIGMRLMTIQLYESIKDF